MTIVRPIVGTISMERLGGVRLYDFAWMSFCLLVNFLCVLIEPDMHVHLYLRCDEMIHTLRMQFSKAGIGVSHYQAMQRALH